jgi:hypothetical protein
MPITLNFTKDNVEKFKSAFGRVPDLEDLHGQLRSLTRFGERVELNIDQHVRKPRFLEAVYEVAQGLSDRSIMTQVSGLRSFRDAPATEKLGRRLQGLEVGIISFMMEGFIDGWLYEKTAAGKMVPWLVTRCEFHAGRDAEERDSVELYMRARSPKAGHGSSDVSANHRSFDYADVSGKTIPEILAAVQLFHETTELKAAYDRDLEAFFEIQPADGQQFLAWGSMGPLGGSWWWRSERSARAITAENPIRVVNDESAIERAHTGLQQREGLLWQRQGIEKELEVPYHPFILFFSLDDHAQYWIHSTDVRPYPYDKSIRDKLILPQDHRDLIDLLTSDDGGVSDIVVGKGLGTSILCLGPPGTGKTLTAEVYSEIVEKPLYSVHSGQLGTDGDHVEKNLREVFARAARWGAILLIDEADVYVRERDNDTEHNAIVASFLRTMEYYRGLMFMTSNRTDDVDDAIKSRAAAIIKYEAPKGEVAERIWMIHLRATGLSDSLASGRISMAELVEKFPKATGRDIRNILALAARVVRGTDRKLDMELVRQCAMFKGVI